MPLTSSLVGQVITEMEDGEVEIGTAYPIRQNVIITARHVIPDFDNFHKTNVQWKRDDDDAVVLKKQLTKIIYESEKFDLVIAGCETPENTPSVDLTDTAPLAPTEYWDSCGYSRSGKNYEKCKRVKVPESGNFVFAKDDDYIQQLRVDDKNSIDLWRGMSGAPVFLASRNRLVAIIIKTPLKDEDGNAVQHNRICAVSIPYLLENDPVFAEQVKRITDESVKQMQEDFQEYLCTQIVHILKKQNIPFERLAIELDLTGRKDPERVADKLVKHSSAGDAVSVLFTVSQELKKQLETHPNQWDQYYYDTEQLCGWLLINSLDSVWWFKNQQRIKQQFADTVSGEAAFPPYVEVIISRGLEQRARHCLDDQGEIKPDGEMNDVFLFDAVSKGASDENLLIPVFNDLRGDFKPPSTVKELLKSIIKTARSFRKARKNKPIYYLVKQDFLDLLQEKEWFKEFENDLAGYLHFVGINNRSDKTGQNPCQEDQEDLLEIVANILRLQHK